VDSIGYFRNWVIELCTAPMLGVIIIIIMLYMQYSNTEQPKKCNYNDYLLCNVKINRVIYRITVRTAAVKGKSFADVKATSNSI